MKQKLLQGIISLSKKNGLYLIFTLNALIFFYQKEKI